MNPRHNNRGFTHTWSQNAQKGGSNSQTTQTGISYHTHANGGTERHLNDSDTLTTKRATGGMTQ